MGKRISPTAIGMFVVGSFALVVIAIVVVGSGSLFKRPVRFVCMFQGNVNGLRIGAPAKFKGVQVGTVEQIKLVLSPSEGELKSDKTDMHLAAQFRNSLLEVTSLPVIIGINREMKLAPVPAGSFPVLLFEPFTFAVNLETGAIDEQLQGPGSRSLAACRT